MELRERIQSSILVKVLTVGVLLLLLLIPIASVQNLTEEREGRRGEVVAEIAGKWGQSQTIVGPALVVPYRYVRTEERENAQGKMETRRIETLGRAVFLPEDLKIDGDVKAEQRARGIFETVLYQGDLDLRATFKAPDFSRIQPTGTPDWSKAIVVLGISDPIGIQSVESRWNGALQTVEPGGNEAGLGGAAVYFRAPDLRGGGVLQTNLTLRGSAELLFAPAGRNTSIELRSPWSSPAFSGAALPTAREVSASGFTASWKLAHYSRSVPQEWGAEGASSGQLLAQAASGVRLILTADIYQKTIRALKYAFLFIGLTFAAFFLFEIFYQLRIHPFQYLLVGAAMIVFYSLFLALSEHIGFISAYLIAAGGVIGVIAGYCRSILGDWKRAGGIAAVITSLYAYLFVTLESEDLALLLGAVALFGALALVMYATRRIDWYNLRLGGVRTENANG